MLTISAGAQWTTYTTSNSGIPDNSIWDLAVDSSNTIWIATDYGLGSFDGTNWNIYDVNNAPIPANSNNDIFAVFIDDVDHVWIGTDGGYLLEFDHFNNVWTDHTTFTFGDIHVIRQDQDGHMWVGHSNGVQERIGTAWTEYQTNLPAPYVESIDIDQNNTVWIGTNGGVAEYDNVSQWANYTDANTSMSGNIWTESIQAGIGNDVWVGTRGGIYRFDQAGSWTKFNSSNSGLLDDEIKSIEVDADGIVWVANDAASMGVYENSFWTPINLPFNVSFSRVVLIDNDGYKWVGCQNALIKYNTQGSGNIATAVLAEQELGMELGLHPNPTSGYITLSVGSPIIGSVQIRVFNGQGKEVKSMTRFMHVERSEINVDLSHLSTGAYSILLTTERSSAYSLVHIAN
jgi:ligand-binding sensor domain-containing protein